MLKYDKWNAYIYSIYFFLTLFFFVDNAIFIDLYFYLCLQLSSFTSSTRHYLSGLFFVKRLQAMQTFFHMCTQYAANLQGKMFPRKQKYFGFV